MSSLRTLAKSLNLSITTVSRALDGYPDVSEKTRQRVKEAADASGYTPNAAARRLRKGTTEVVMMVLPAEPGHFNEPLYIGLLATLGERLAKAGYDLALIAAPPGPGELKAYRRIVEGRRADALVVVRTRRDDAARPAISREPTFPSWSWAGPRSTSPTPSWTAMASRPSPPRPAGCRRSATSGSPTSLRRRL